MAVSGDTLLLYQSASVFGSQRGFTFDRSDELIDVTDKANRDKQYIAGKRSVTFTLDQFYVEGDGRYGVMRGNYEGTGTSVLLQIYDTSGLTPSLVHAGAGKITSLSVTAVSNEAALLSMTVESDGDVWD